MTPIATSLGEAAWILAGSLAHEQHGRRTAALASTLERIAADDLHLETLARTLQRSLVETRAWVAETARLLRAFPAEGLVLSVLVERLELVGWAFAAVPDRGMGLTAPSRGAT